MALQGTSRAQFGAVSELVVGPERCERSKGSTDDGNLIPTIPDEISITLILPRVSWRTMRLLGKLNRAWQDALKSSAMYEARVWGNRKQTIVTIDHYKCTVSLYDTAAESWHVLPRPPFGHMMVARGCGCVSVEGKLYILGGNKEDFQQPRNEVHVIDLVKGHGRWRQCASMKTARKHFACGVKDGKIYAFGGMGADTSAEVYDPTTDSWHDIAPMLNPRIEHKVVNVDNVFCVHMGRFYDSNCRFKMKWGYAHFADIYDPAKDEWTRIETFTSNESSRFMGANIADCAVVIGGRMHRILDECLYVAEDSVQSGEVPRPVKWDLLSSWKVAQKISWDVLDCEEEACYFNVFARAALAIASGGELLALVFGKTPSMSSRNWIFLKSVGLGCKDRKLVWRRIHCPIKSLPESRVRSSWSDDGFQFAPCICALPGTW